MGTSIEEVALLVIIPGRLPPGYTNGPQRRSIDEKVRILRKADSSGCIRHAARSGREGNCYVWGNELMPGGKHMCNIFQGKFPEYNSGEDGFIGTALVDSFEPNGYGLYNMAGNVWEWGFDWWSPDFHLTGGRNNPIGPETGARRVNRGGSYLCHDSYCNRYRVAARTSNTPDSSAGNQQNPGLKFDQLLPTASYDWGGEGRQRLPSSSKYQPTRSFRRLSRLR